MTFLLAVLLACLLCARTSGAEQQCKSLWPATPLTNLQTGDNETVLGHLLEKVGSKDLWTVVKDDVETQHKYVMLSQDWTVLCQRWSNQQMMKEYWRLQDERKRRAVEKILEGE